MKKKYIRLEIHTKQATVTEKEECTLIESECYFDKKDVEIICKQNSYAYTRRLPDNMVNEYIKNTGKNLYTVITDSSKVDNVVLSKEELEYLCE